MKARGRFARASGAWLAFGCALFAFGASAAGIARAENRALVLATNAKQSAGDIDFSLPPRWTTPAKCGPTDVRDTCLLAKMTAEADVVPPSEIVQTALRMAAFFDARKGEDPDGVVTLRAGEAYLIAGAFELRGSHAGAARKYFALALSRARDVPAMTSSYTQALPVQTQPNRLGAPGTTGVRTIDVSGERQSRNPLYAPAELVREYATRALATLGD